jgi:hypothetical protein
MRPRLGRKRIGAKAAKATPIQGVIESCTDILTTASCRTRKKYLKNSMSKNKITFIF